MPRFILSLDFSVQPYSIGDTLLALAGAMADADAEGADGLDVVAYVPPGPHRDPNMAEAHSRPWESLGRLLPLLSLFPVHSFTAVPEGPRGHYRTYEACQSIAAYHRRHGHPPRLCFPPDLCSWADGFLDEYGPRVVTVNLRRNMEFHHHRNADLGVWRAALELAGEDFGVRFLVVGDPHEFSSALGRVACHTKDRGTTLLQDLALVHRSKAHIGTTSGPMAVAMLGSAPYFFVRADMQPHLARYGGSLVEDSTGCMAFSFAAPRQRFSPEAESVPLLVEAIRGLVS